MVHADTMPPAPPEASAREDRMNKPVGSPIGPLLALTRTSGNLQKVSYHGLPFHITEQSREPARGCPGSELRSAARLHETVTPRRRRSAHVPHRHD